MELDPQAVAIAHAASDAALALLRREIREAGLSGLGQFDFGSLISTAIKAAGDVATAKIAQSSAKTAASTAQKIEAMRISAEQKTAELAAQAASYSGGGFTATIAQPTVWIPVALAGGALVLFMMMRK